MQIEVITGANVEGCEDLADRIRAAVGDALSDLRSRVVRVKVHLGYAIKSVDKQCMMEARLGCGFNAVSHHAATAEQAVDGAARKLRISVESTLHRRRNFHVATSRSEPEETAKTVEHDRRALERWVDDGGSCR